MTASGEVKEHEARPLRRPIPPTSTNFYNIQGYYLIAALSYCLATCIDGFLARNDGSVDWLNPFQTKLNTPYDFEVYYKTVSTVLMGRKTILFHLRSAESNQSNRQPHRTQLTPKVVHCAGKPRSLRLRGC